MPPNGQGKCCINLLEVEAVRDVVCSHEAGQQVSDSSSLSTVRSELECVHSSFPGCHKKKPNKIQLLWALLHTFNLIEIQAFIQQLCIKIVKCDCKDTNCISGKCCSFFNFPFVKESCLFPQKF